MLKYKFDMKVMEKKHRKMRNSDRDDLDYDDISEEEFDDEESKKFAEYIKEKRETLLKEYED